MHASPAGFPAPCARCIAFQLFAAATNGGATSLGCATPAEDSPNSLGFAAKVDDARPARPLFHLVDLLDLVDMLDLRSTSGPGVAFATSRDMLNECELCSQCRLEPDNGFPSCGFEKCGFKDVSKYE